MRTSTWLCGAAMFLAAICLSVAQDKDAGKKTDNGARSGAARNAADKTALPQSGNKGDASGAKSDAGSSAEEEPAESKAGRGPDGASAEEDVIRETALSFARAHAAADAQAVAAHFTPDAEYVDEQGNAFHGRAAIEGVVRRFFEENPGAQLEVNIESIRVLSPGVALEDGTSTVTLPDGKTASHCRYAAVHARADGEWQIASVREHAPKGQRPHHEELKQLEWLVGDWIDEDDDSVVTFACQPVDNGNFLLREFTVMVAGEKIMSGTQRIGWDPLTGRLRAWTFDSEGGFFEGIWHRDGNNWVLHSTGVTSSGQTASGISIFTFVNPHTMTWQSVDLEVDGVRMPDSELYTLVRRGPQPE